MIGQIVISGEEVGITAVTSDTGLLVFLCLYPTRQRIGKISVLDYTSANIKQHPLALSLTSPTRYGTENKPNKMAVTPFSSLSFAHDQG